MAQPIVQVPQQPSNSRPIVALGLRRRNQSSAQDKTLNNTIQILDFASTAVKTVPILGNSLEGGIGTVKKILELAQVSLLGGTSRNSS